MAGLLLFAEIFEMFNSPESYKLPDQEQCQTLRNMEGMTPKPVNLTSAGETPFKFAKNQKTLSSDRQGMVAPSFTAAAFLFLLGNRLFVDSLANSATIIFHKQ